MLQPRIIPVLLLDGNGLVKTTSFKNPAYVGDPINAVKIFNDKGADELMIIDLQGSRGGKPDNLSRLRDITSEAFMPVSYGGGIRTPEDVENLVRCGVEKVVIGSAASKNPVFIKEAVKAFGGSTISVSADYRKVWLQGTRVFTDHASNRTKYEPLEFCKQMEDSGVGEIVLHNADRDGTMKGYDFDSLNVVCNRLRIPVIACGGASGYDDFPKAYAAGASGAAAGSVFIYSGVHRAVLINYPSEAWRVQSLHKPEFPAAVS